MNSLERLAQATALLPGDTSEERWARLVEQRMVAIGEPPFTQWWWDTLIEFWKSGKTALAVGKANRAGGTTHIQGMCAAPESLFRERKAIADSELVWANSSATVPLANGTLRLFAATLRALGMTEQPRRSKNDAKRLSPGDFFISEGSNAGPGTVEFLDICGNRCEFRSQPASRAGLSGFTGIGFTPDEVELWGGDKDNPTDLLDLGLSRLKGQPGTHAYAISRLFAEDGPLALICKRGDNEGLMIARLRKSGAEADERARLSLKRHLQDLARAGDRDARVYSEDARLTEEADPTSYIIPAWAALPEGGQYGSGPEAAIRDCWRLASIGWGLEPGEVPIDGLFRVYGGRPTGHEGARYFDARFLREARKRTA